MKKSELKEMIKMAMTEDARTDAEQEGYKDGFEDAKDDIEDKLKDMKVSEQEDVDVEDNEDINIDVEDTVDVDDESAESDIEVKSELPGEDTDTAAVLGLLTKAQEKAEGMGDEKLMDQIGNTITYYTRAHVVASTNEEVVAEETVEETVEEKVELDESLARFKKLAGLIK